MSISNQVRIFWKKIHSPPCGGSLSTESRKRLKSLTFWFTTFFYLTNFKLLNAASQRQLSLLCDSNSIQQMLRTWFCNLDRLKEMDVAVVVAVPRLGPKVLCWVTGIIRLLSTSVFDIRSILLKVLVSTAVPQEPNNNTFRP